MLNLSFGLLLVALAVFLLGRFAAVRVLQLQRCRKIRDEFFASALSLIEDERTPEIYVSILEFLGNAIVRKHLSWRTLWRLLTGRIDQTHDPASGSMRALTTEFPLPEDLRRTWNHVETCFTLAITFNNALAGAVVRLLIPWPVTGRSTMAKSQRAAAVVQDLVVTEMRLPECAAA
jgi:hypothetical protein